MEDENASIERRLRKLVEAIADGVSARTLKDELLRLEARQQELGAILAKPAETRPLIHPALARIYRRKVAELHVFRRMLVHTNSESVNQNRARQFCRSSRADNDVGLWRRMPRGFQPLQSLQVSFSETRHRHGQEPRRAEPHPFSPGDRLCHVGIGAMVVVIGATRSA
jgi:hypothetical protein